MDQREALASSWSKNAENWTRAVREGLIPSRGAGTDDAIVEAICCRKPQSFLDVGCGEGWLVRRIVKRTGCHALGIDGSAQLIADARQADPDGRYQVVDYRELVERRAGFDESFDVIAFNYALFDEEASRLLEAIRPYLSAGGRIVIQTLHPWALSREGHYLDAWRREDFSAFKNQDWTSMPWYFRTLASWHDVIRNAGLMMAELREPAAKPGGLPLSLLLICAAFEQLEEKRSEISDCREDPADGNQ
ncbi:class I SAM-dependent methyltransferase [Denitrobaculum tricleocarpae]|uniref:Class I SAM-dependent methyltransferase n=1 Tax=Denitrobaculum tricleocarpae TaxID=2591009 RepID=A0A545TM85_9PROT|nr:class I SAM-dependent methyltransferase [Denitrobaculum tricleocarpae]TQV78343.1 class I SAM-dependent methyltransferase [Denitrobaculum tricleocarpae]